MNNIIELSDLTGIHKLQGVEYGSEPYSDGFYSDEREYVMFKLDIEKGAIIKM